MSHIKGLSFFLLVLMLVSTSVSAADLRIRIFERGGTEAMQGVAVCLGTPANVSQFGAELTDNKGYVVFKGFPRAPLQVTVSKSGFKSEQQSIVTTNTNRLLVLSLAHGGGGKQCRLNKGHTSVSSGDLSISRFSINKGAGETNSREVKLNNTISGQPTHYRASESSDFSGAAWKVWSKAPDFQLSAGAGSKAIYFQVRRHATINGANIETHSPVVHRTITLK